MRLPSLCSLILLLPLVSCTKPDEFREGGYLAINSQATFFQNSGGDDTPLSTRKPIESSSGFGLGLATGYSLQGLRTEFEITGRRNQFHHPDFSRTFDGRSVSFMGNLYYDFNNTETSSWIPYLGGGAGMSYMSPGNAFAYQFMGGLGLKVGEQSIVYGGYRYFIVPDGKEYKFVSKTKTEHRTLTGNMDYTAHIFEIGLRNYF